MLYVLAAVALLSPLPLGGYFPWVSSLSALLVGAVLLGHVSHRMWRGSPACLPPPLASAALLIVAVSLWVLAQGHGGSLSPIDHSLWGVAADYGVPHDAGVSLAPATTETALMRLLTHVGIFWLAWVNAQRRERAHRLLMVLFAGQVVYAAYGFVRLFGGSEHILWIQIGESPVLTSTFVNRNTYATFANLGILAGLGLLLSRIPLRNVAAEGWRAGFLRFVPELMERHAYVWIGLAVLAAASFTTASRGGFLSLCLAIVTLAILQRPIKTRASIGLATLTSIGLFVLMLPFAGETGVDRILAPGGALPDETRLAIWRQTIEGIGEAPIVGTGLGTFEDAYLVHSSTDVPFDVDKAHNTYLEHVLELGLPAAAAFYALFLLLFRLCARQGHRPLPAIGAASIVLVGAHALVDFSMQLPGVSFMFVTILGTACARAYCVPMVGTPAANAPVDASTTQLNPG